MQIASAMDKRKIAKDEKHRESQPRTDSAPFVPVFDKKPAERSPKEIKEAIEADAILERHDEHSR